MVKRLAAEPSHVLRGESELAHHNSDSEEVCRRAVLQSGTRDRIGT
ncbi:MAG TPA: hypothetical protein VIH78_16050 [Terriglobales bacterium]